MESVASRLLRWYDASRRDLPWRRTRDPWAILVSEVMLQQTRVAAVRPAYERFIAQYATAADFAACSDDALLAAWRGLGYYRRARRLRETAQLVVARHGGCLPADADTLARLPGIGAYTCCAVASMAFDAPLAAIDGNVERVVARHRGISDPIELRAAKAAVAACTRSWLDRRRPGDFNQAIMELGATVCGPTAPRCSSCPIAGDCLALATDRVDILPVRRPKPAPVVVEARCIVATTAEGVVAFRIPDDEPNGGHWDLPGPGPLVAVSAKDLAAATALRCGIRVRVGKPLFSVRHAITNHRIVLTAHAGRILTPRGPGISVQSQHDDAVPWTTTARKVLTRFAATTGTQDGAPSRPARSNRP